MATPNDTGTLDVTDSDDPLPMFQMSDPAVQQASAANLDLDDLFVDCYFDVPGFPQPAPDAAPQAPPVTHNAILAAPAATPVAAATAAPAVAIAAATPQTVATAAAIVATPAAITAAPAVALPTQATSTEPAPDTTTSEDRKRSAADAELGLDKLEDGKELTDKQKLERRERNREHAKRSRLRKKFLLESLQEQIHGLQEQMEKLKAALKREIPHKASAIIEDVCGNKDKYTPLPMPSGFGPVKTLMEPDFRLMSALSGSQQNFAISDPTLPDNPIVYVSQGFLMLTGYTLDQVLGRNCRFLQGPGTDQSAVDVIRKGINEGVDTSVCLLNYKADGTPFWNQFFVAALRDAENNVVNYVGVQCEVSKAVVEKHMGDKKKRGP